MLQARREGSQRRESMVLLPRVSNKIPQILQPYQALERGSSLAMAKRPQEVSVRPRRGRLLQAANREVRVHRRQRRRRRAVRLCCERVHGREKVQTADWRQVTLSQSRGNYYYFFFSLYHCCFFSNTQFHQTWYTLVLADSRLYGPRFWRGEQLRPRQPQTKTNDWQLWEIHAAHFQHFNFNWRLGRRWQYYQQQNCRNSRDDWTSTLGDTANYIEERANWLTWISRLFCYYKVMMTQVKLVCDFLFNFNLTTVNLMFFC